MRKILIDSDVMLDLFIAREPHHEAALRFFSYLEANAESVTPFASPVAIANVAYILAKAKDQRYALRKIHQLRTLLGIAAVDESIVDAAMARPHRDFEDSIQYHCASHNGIGLLVTRNERDYPAGEVVIVGPIDFMRLDSAEKAT
ncbi:MAG: PIN domain-containing protein [Spirochaetia bacterium]